MSQSYPQQGVGSYDREHDQFIRHDGSVRLSANWEAGASRSIQVGRMLAEEGGMISIGNFLARLRLCYNTDEIAELLGVSNNQAILYLKNLRIADLSGVGNRNVIADVNGDLSAP